MRPRSSAVARCALLSALVLAGCGAGPSGQGAAPANAPRALTALSTVVTDGRTGDAVIDTSTGPLRHLSRGGRPDPSPRPRTDGVRNGIGAGDSCPEVELVPAADNLDRVEATTLCLLNAERMDRGLIALRLDDRLARAALGHTRDMVARTYFSHEGRNGSTLKHRVAVTGYLPAGRPWTIGENLAWGTGALATPRAITNAWMNSSGHRANILKPEYREIGFGTVLGNPQRSDGYGATYATDFGVVAGPAASRATRVRQSAGKRRSACAKQVRRARASRRTAKQRQRACEARSKRNSR